MAAERNRCVRHLVVDITGKQKKSGKLGVGRAQEYTEKCMTALWAAEGLLQLLMLKRQWLIWKGGGAILAHSALNTVTWLAPPYILENQHPVSSSSISSSLQNTAIIQKVVPVIYWSDVHAHATVSGFWFLSLISLIHLENKSTYSMPGSCSSASAQRSVQ